jgi:hypothetical protein
VRFARCVAHPEHSASLELHKLYRVVPDAEAEHDGVLRVADESGQDHLVPAEWFEPVELATLVAKLMASDSHRRTHPESLSDVIASVDTPEGRKRVADYLAKQSFPHFEAAPDAPRLLVQIDADGTRTVGRFVGRQFVPTAQPRDTD